MTGCVSYLGISFILLIKSSKNFVSISQCSPFLLPCSSDPECWEEDESSRSSETSTCLCCCPSPTALSSHWGTICLPTLPPPLPPVVATPERRKGESAPVNMPGWRSQWRLVLLNSLTCGLEICVAAGITYVPPLLLEAGVEERYMTMVLGEGSVKTESGGSGYQASVQPHSVCMLVHVFPYSLSHICIISPSLSLSDKVFIKHEKIDCWTARILLCGLFTDHMSDCFLSKCFKL